MTYNFDEVIDRTNNYAVKLDESGRKFGADVLPMWIADMDFRTAQPILDAIDVRNRLGIFGYTSRPDEYFEDVCAWQERRNGYRFDPAKAAFALGVIPAITVIIEQFTAVSAEIAFFTPVYSEFNEAVVNSGRTPLTIPLKETDGYYEIDFDLFEAAARRRPDMLIMCNPHNPVGRTWTPEELRKVGEICLRYGIFIISDEIHSDLQLFGNRHTVFASLSKELADHMITCTSASKTFNLAGLQAATIFFPTAIMRDRYLKFWKHMDVHRNNCFSLVANMAAMKYGDEWLDQLLPYLGGNAEYVYSFLQTNIPEVRIHKPESTYLLWLDCRKLELSGDALPKFMIQEAGLGFNDGRSFGADGEGFMRMNIACPRSTVEKAMSLLKAAVDRKYGRS